MRKFIAPALFALTALCGSALAQTATETPRPTGSPINQNTVRPTGQAEQTGAANLDQHIAACLLLGNQEQVALAEFAADKAKHDEVKKFAQMMVEHHQKAIAKIEQAAPQLASMNLMLRNAKTGSDASAESGADAGLDPSLQLARQVKEECLAITQKALNEKEGAEFDKCYITQQVLAHMQMWAGLKGSEPFASQQLKPVIAEGTKMTEEHLAKAKDLLKKLESDDSGKQASAQ